ncbi:MAG TPA: hypothetical protein VN668_05960 [Stellaceae bacterium]|nr:hypothetical protein [Stellaceae bacterium]
MTEPSPPGNGRRFVEYRSVITLGNLLSILTIVITVAGGAIWWNGDLQARLATLELKMQFAQSALAAVAQKMGIDLTDLEANRGELRYAR